MDGDAPLTRIREDRHKELAVASKSLLKWLHAENRLLNGERPLGALREGQQQKSQEAAQAFVDGFYI
ncbi:hypothetical protein GCM10009582_11120 [Arthrobacter flavus]